jgi:hypothetical protein
MLAPEGNLAALRERLSVPLVGDFRWCAQADAWPGFAPEALRVLGLLPLP